jgi:hypothetical protein
MADIVRLTEEQWQAIRSSWEYDPDEPSLLVAGERAGKKYQFRPPSKSAIHKRTETDKKRGNSWERRSSMSGINIAAHRKADALVEAGSGRKVDSAVDGEHQSVLIKTQVSRDDAEDLRAEINARHRNEWKAVGVLINEAINLRNSDPIRASDKMKFAKLAAETVKIKQDGERKAWGMEVLVGDMSKMTDEQLESIIRGVAPK